MRWVAELGCFCCERPANLHHIRPPGTGIGRRTSHFHVIPLCHDHHLGNFSIHMAKKAFEEKFGIEIPDDAAETIQTVQNAIDYIENKK